MSLWELFKKELFKPRFILSIFFGVFISAAFWVGKMTANEYLYGWGLVFTLWGGLAIRDYVKSKGPDNAQQSD